MFEDSLIESGGQIKTKKGLDSDDLDNGSRCP